MPDYVEELLSERGIGRHGLFHPAAVAALVRKCRAGEVIGNSDEMALVGILSTQLFSHMFIQGSQSGVSGADDFVRAPALHR